jgi:hypothetical protein
VKLRSNGFDAREKERAKVARKTTLVVALRVKGLMPVFVPVLFCFLQCAVTGTSMLVYFHVVKLQLTMSVEWLLSMIQINTDLKKAWFLDNVAFSFQVSVQRWSEMNQTPYYIFLKQNPLTQFSNINKKLWCLKRFNESHKKVNKMRNRSKQVNETGTSAHFHSKGILGALPLTRASLTDWSVKTCTLRYSYGVKLSKYGNVACMKPAAARG